LKSIKNENSKYVEHVEGTNKDIKYFQSIVSDQKFLISQKDQRIAKLEGEVRKFTSLEKQNSETEAKLKDELKLIKNELSNQGNQNKSLETSKLKLNNQKKLISEKEQTISFLEGEVERLKKLEKKNSETISKLETDLAVIKLEDEKKITYLKKKNSELIERCSNLDDKIEELMIQYEAMMTKGFHSSKTVEAEVKKKEKVKFVGAEMSKNKPSDYELIFDIWNDK
jgi:chromosome segregation ATPase